MSIIPAALDPTFIAHIKAKSLDLGGDTLAEHTWCVLSRLADQQRLRPGLAAQFKDSRLWHHLYWGCFLHDFGKAAAGFQERLQTDAAPNTWSEGRHRHEILSLAFVDWVCPRDDPDRPALIGVIAAHHKDLEGEQGIFRRYGTIDYDPHQKARLQFLIDQLSPETIAGLWRWLNEYGRAWSEALGFEGVGILAFRQAAIHVDGIVNALDSLYDYADGQRGTTAPIYLRGLILTADHAASAGTGTFPTMPLDMPHAEKPLLGLSARAHQIAARNVGEGSHILMAPTGSGKTEAALFWAARQMVLRPAARLFYTLQYQASMKAMVTRLWERYFRATESKVGFESAENQTVMIQHSRATLYLYRMMMESDASPHARTVAKQAREQKNRAQLNFYPVQVFSPYQMLKATFALKGYEALLLDYTGALFIFDEIHAYDPARLALIVETIRWLRASFGARFFIMTATLSPHLQEKLMAALDIGTESLLTADDATFSASRRHRVRLHEGALGDPENLDKAVADYHAGKSVLVCCNQVKRALAIYDQLRATVGEDAPILLLHSRFNGADRAQKEHELMAGYGLRSGWQKQAGSRTPCIVVATQVVEVSLDVDFDTIYTEPAPLEALIQRFGRVNRARAEQQLVDVHVMRQPVTGKDTLPYDADMVARSLAVLEDNCADKVIDEALVSTLLGKIYEGDILAAWTKQFEGKQRDIRNTIEAITPFQSADDQRYWAYYEMFDGVQVLPLSLENEYIDAREKEGFLAASGFLVNISWQQYAMIKGRGGVKGTGEQDEIPRVNVPYTTERGLDLYAALAQEDEDE